MKSYTDLEQSKKLAEILPPESADMVYIWHATSDNPAFRFDNDMSPMVLKDVPIEDVAADTLPCWSLTALLEVLPSSTLDSSNDHYYRLHCMEKFTEWHDNPIDVCYEMIEKLHEQKLL